MIETTKEFISYNVVISEFINHSDSCHKTYSEAKQAIVDKLNELSNNSKMSKENKDYWIGKYSKAIIVESISKYTVLQ